MQTNLKEALKSADTELSDPPFSASFRPKFTLAQQPQEFSMKQRNHFLIKLASMAVFSLFLVACSAPEDSDMNSDSADMASNFDLTLTIPELMSYELDPASDSVWGAGGWVLDA